MDELSLFIPLSKVDASARMLYGTMIAEEPDRSGEIFDYDSSKPYVMAWSSDFEKVTGGKSLGNVRAMHGTVAAGKLVAIDYDDTAKEIRIAVEVADDAEWFKCQMGIYTGFSLGGRYVRRWTDANGKKRYTGNPKEVSLVDRPSVPSATFTLRKADGTEVQVPFGGTQDDLQKREFSEAERKTDAKSGAALPDGSFPIENEQDLKNAIHAYGRAKNKEAARAHIEKRARDLGLTSLLPDNWAKIDGPKGDETMSGMEKKDAGCLCPSCPIKGSCDCTPGSGCTCPNTKKADAGVDFKKFEETLGKKIEEMFSKVEAENKELKDRLEKMEKQPGAPKAFRTVGKEDDTRSAAEEKPIEPLRKADGTIDNEATALAHIKASFKKPMTYYPG